ncbi:ProQ/FinO family protein [Pararhizobium sp. BT-229]|uniref:ProQ/FinO family protein n=1 Tax=Pararhizobium sp. BT-229 TaxID=2986923 RepID=UPI0021F72702|nr:ProQ/FinO family protein [Pararhizobium sp. BT-229]MCV9964756.1 ProQ/FinO family protein [Pararhizobium sp. BT-229]
MGKFSEEKVARILVFAATLAERHPKAFPSGKPGQTSTVLKIGIHFDIYALYPDIPKRTVRSLMSWHTRSRKYLEAASVAGTPRLDLHGDLAGEVTEEQAKAAQDNLAERKARSKASKTAARKATARKAGA